MSDEAQLFDRRLLVRRRDRAAAGAAAHDFLLQRVAEDFAVRLGAVQRRFPTVLDLGAHHGVLARSIASLAGVSMVISAEASWRLLTMCPPPRVLVDPEMLPFGDGSLDLVVSGLTLHHVNDVPGTLVQVRRALKPDGLLLAAVLGGRTLTELREAFLLAESDLEGGASPRVAPYADVRDYGSLLQRAGFALPVVDADVVTVTYASPLALMRDIRGMGATNVLVSRRRRPLRRSTLMRAGEIYVEHHARPDGRVPATFEIITLTGWAPHESQQKPLRPGSAQVRLADALGTREIKTGDKAAPKPGKNGR
ncbi:MAG: methyltransferase domain-containing protein [Hyphomicrobiaceae bacterium]|nr:methyltransferase domain-containing protein [Hyphomicrobiaceae bacterium]